VVETSPSPLPHYCAGFEIVAWDSRARGCSKSQRGILLPGSRNVHDGSRVTGYSYLARQGKFADHQPIIAGSPRECEVRTALNSLNGRLKHDASAKAFLERTPSREWRSETLYRYNVSSRAGSISYEDQVPPAVASHSDPTPSPSIEKRVARVLLLLAHFWKQGKQEAVIPKMSQGTLAKMIDTMRSRVSFSMNRFQKVRIHPLRRRKRLASPQCLAQHHSPRREPSFRKGKAKPALSLTHLRFAAILRRRLL
jgi:hypothetical protein